MDWWIFDEATKDRKSVTYEEYKEWNARRPWPAQMALGTLTTPSGKKLCVSSVFLTSDHGHGGSPVHFESMVFEVNDDGSWGNDLNAWRAYYYDQLMEKHDEIVGSIREGFFQDYGGQTHG